METVAAIWIACSASFLVGWMTHALLAGANWTTVSNEEPKAKRVIDLAEATEEGELASSPSRGEIETSLPLKR